MVERARFDVRNLIGGEEEVLAPRVHLITVARQMMKNNNYLVVDPVSRQAVVVDPAWEIDKVHAALSASQSSLGGILVTHAHFDHIDLAARLSDIHDCPVWMSPAEIAASGFRARRLVPIDESPWFVGAMRIVPILTPGHTPGCVCYLIGDNLFSGDVLFAEGCGICANVEAAHAMYDSLERLKSQLAPHTRVYPGHTYVRPPGQRFSDVLNHNMYLHFPDRDAFAAFRLRKGQSVQQLMNFR
jgi:hydroxyacylglutathione hydrolase